MIIFRKTKLGTMETSNGAQLIKHGTKWVLMQNGKQLNSLKELR